MNARRKAGQQSQQCARSVAIRIYFLGASIRIYLFARLSVVGKSMRQHVDATKIVAEALHPDEERQL